MMFLFVCFILIIVCFVVLEMIPPDDVRKEKDKELPSMRGLFDADKETFGQNENFYIGVNEQNKHVKIGLNTSKHFRTADSYRHYSIITRTFDYKDIISVEIIEDSVTVSKTNRTSQLVGAGIGGAIAGGAGAIVGGLSGKTTGTTEIKNITLRIVLNDEQNSVFDLPFLEKKHPIKKSSSEYSAAMNSIHNWHSVLTKIIEKEDRTKEEEYKSAITKVKEDTSASNNNEKNSTNIVEEIERLANMKDKGMLSDLEFNKLKSKLID